MKTSVLFFLGAVFALLGSSWQAARADVAPLRAIEIDEIDRSLDPQLVADLDGNPAIAARAALAIGRTKKIEGAGPLRAHLSAGDPALRTMCAYALGLLSDSDSLSLLRALARRDGTSSVRYAAVDAIGRIALAHSRNADRGLSNDLLIVARTDVDATVRGHAAAQLDAFRSAPFASDVEAALERLVARDAGEGVRWHAMWTIARAYAPFADRAFLKAALKDKNDIVRLEAARAWGRRTDDDAVAIVQTAMNDKSWRVQYEVREAVRRLQKLAPTEHLKDVPAGMNLPSIPPPVVGTAPSPAPVPTGADKPVAPDASAFELETFVGPTTAEAMNAGRPGAHDHALIRTTKGDITIALYREWAPSTVANFVSLAAKHYYDGNRWFRIVPDFVAQTGDPTDDGEGDAGYAIAAEENPIEERSGIIAMGLNYDKNVPDRDSAGTQFYITMSPQLHLDRDFSVFGEVTKGFDVLSHLVESDRIVSVTVVSER